MTPSSTFTLGELAEQLQLECVGDANLEIRGLATLASAGEGELTFLANPKYRRQLADTRASAVILHRDLASETDLPALISDNPYLAFARASALFDDTPYLEGVHPSAVVASTAQLGEGVSIGANAVVGEHCVIGEGTTLHPGAVLSDHVTLGPRCVIFPNVSIYHRVTIGSDARIHSGAVIGADGFGFAPNQGAWTKIFQLGGVRIGDRVEVGAGTTIDRGALDDTVIGNDVIFDSQVLIAHNVVIGDGCAFAGRAAVAGSTTIGKHCTVGGGAGIIGHLTVADRVHVTACTLVTKSINEPGVSYSSGTPMMPTSDWRRSAVRFAQLDTMNKRIAELEKQFKETSGK
ncbi:UDP-3-O-[3-hydroxymyristoyl] glucosamine N-acyltransferase [Litorivivens lipolytica]|uniref:UDP-3-O-acylglucosamine N-acyltransferase n=1 Tax=Litorivivens lipolytica TaxID=1524264 RepID=A0A7W4Z4C9_9GAMM|nr:UDP-3-O-(3-hydroxymyristoyl)glucosamine N-acyltransferase [Litorivivens lipolytica]MBB3045932.1 UDP-3-O-[3-hydroxymyristoyl] glucosamine N-acyltransferase [Litorivivens lipolytica]